MKNSSCESNLWSLSLKWLKYMVFLLWLLVIRKFWFTSVSFSIEIDANGESISISGTIIFFSSVSSSHKRLVCCFISSAAFLATLKKLAKLLRLICMYCIYAYTVYKYCIFLYMGEIHVFGQKWNSMVPSKRGLRSIKIRWNNFSMLLVGIYWIRRRTKNTIYWQRWPYISENFMKRYKANTIFTV